MTRSQNNIGKYKLCLVTTVKQPSSSTNTTTQSSKKRAGAKKERPPRQSNSPPSKDDNSLFQSDDDDHHEDESENESSLHSVDSSSDSSKRDDERDDDDDESTTTTDDEEEEEEFEIPHHVKKDVELKRIFETSVNSLIEQTPTIDMILKTPLRPSHRAKLLEMYFLFRETMPMTEERMDIRDIFAKMWKRYCHEYQIFKEYENEIVVFEKECQKNTIIELQKRIFELETTVENKQVIYRKYVELCEKDQQDEEYFKMKQWITWALELPFDKLTRLTTVGDDRPYTRVLKEMQVFLDKELYGMKQVKEQILLFMHTKFMNPELKGCCLGLVGECGVGKTSIARCLAKVLHFPFEQISFGGIQHVESLKGFDFTYVGSQPGEIVKCLIRMKSKNGILFFDEFEKIANQSEIASFLLHVTDFSQNHTYRDNYCNELVLDLSCLWFIYSMNSVPEDRALKDRIFTIQVPGYGEKDKIEILKQFLFPKQLVAHSFQANDIVLSHDIATLMVRRLPVHEKGVRTLDQMTRVLVSKLSFLYHHQSSISMSFHFTVPTTLPFTITSTTLDICLKDWHTSSESAGHLCMFS